jgi:hypothetical protein
VTDVLGFHIRAVLPRCYPKNRNLVGATGLEPATPCAQDINSAISCDFPHSSRSA